MSVYPVGLVSTAPAKAEARALPKGDCFADGVARGACDASRFAAFELRTQATGTRMVVGHVLDVAAATARPSAPAPLLLTGSGAAGEAVQGWSLARGSETLFAARSRATTGFSMVLPQGVARGVLLLQAPMAVEVAGSLKGGNCHVDIKLAAGNAKTSRRAVVLAIDKACLALIEHPDVVSDALAIAAAPPAGEDPTSPTGEVLPPTPVLDPEVHRMDRELQDLPQGVTYQGAPDPVPTVMPKRGCAASVSGGGTASGSARGSDRNMSLFAMALVLALMCLRRYR